MTDRNKVVWSEGLFLRTQHLQQQDRHIRWLMRHTLAAQPEAAFGFLALDLDPVALDTGQVAVAQAEGFLPDGTFLSVPDGTHEIAPVSVQAKTEAGLVHIAIPSEAAGAAEIGRASCRERV